ncbi:MAG: cytochrome c [Bryobacteraceae bacterium]
MPQAAASLPNPLEKNEQAERAGAKLYAHECAACHGPNREGHGRVPRLNRARVREAPPGELFWILRNGSLHRGMPSFAHLPESERWQIIEFLRQSPATNHAGATQPSR